MSNQPATRAQVSEEASTRYTGYSLARSHGANHTATGQHARALHSGATITPRTLRSIGLLEPVAF